MDSNYFVDLGILSYEILVAVLMIYYLVNVY